MWLGWRISQLEGGVRYAWHWGRLAEGPPTMVCLPCVLYEGKQDITAGRAMNFSYGRQPLDATCRAPCILRVHVITYCVYYEFMMMPRWPGSCPPLLPL